MRRDYEQLARLFAYPGESYVERCREAGLHEFAKKLEELSATDIEERFVSTFDWDPATALELGWHLFGEQYARGEFLVRMREELRRYSVAESAELPDHLTHVLRIVDRMDDEAAEKFVREYVAPALAKLQAALEQKKTPFAILVQAVRDALPVQAAIPVLKVELP